MLFAAAMRTDSFETCSNRFEKMVYRWRDKVPDDYILKIDVAGFDTFFPHHTATVEKNCCQREFSSECD